MIVGLHVALDKGSHLHKILDTAFSHLHNILDTAAV